MYSLNVPVPGEVRRLAGELRPSLLGFEAVRDEPTLVAKRLDATRATEDGTDPGRYGTDPGRHGTDPGEYAAVEKAARAALAGAPVFEARVSGVDYFADPPAGPAPVVYLAVESPGLLQLHRRLVDAFGAVPGLEGDEYVPHVTLARGGNRGTVERLAAREIEPVAWTVTTLEFFDARHDERTGTVSLPA